MTKNANSPTSSLYSILDQVTFLDLLHCLSLTFHCLSLTFHCLSLTSCCLSLTSHCPSLTPHCSSLTSHCPSLTFHCSSLTSLDQVEDYRDARTGMLSFKMVWPELSPINKNTQEDPMTCPNSSCFVRVHQTNRRLWLFQVDAVLQPVRRRRNCRRGRRLLASADRVLRQLR